MLSLGADIWFIVKIMFLVGMALYLVFSLIVIRQVWHMTSTLKVGFESPIKLFAVTHFFGAVGVLLFALLYL